MALVRLRLPRWSAHPVFGVAVLLALAVALIIHGEPQPSSRPSGTSVVVGSASASPVVLKPTLLVRDGSVELRTGNSVRKIGLPAGAVALSVASTRGLAVVLAARDGVQQAYGVSATGAVLELGAADEVIAAGAAGAAVVIERGVSDPGRLDEPVTASGSASTRSPVLDSPHRSASAGSSASARSSASAGSSASARLSASPVGSKSSATTGIVPARDYTARRYDSNGRPVGKTIVLPPGYQIAVDTPAGLTVWKPTGVVLDGGQIAESLSATATLIRPDGSLRVIGAVHPLAATATELLVWDVAHGEFGLMSLIDATASTTQLALPEPAASSASGSQSGALSSDPPLDSAVASVSPSTVAGTRWFQPTRGFVVSGPASFSADGSAFASYAQVGSRRRLVIGRVAAVGTNQIAVLALAQPATQLSSSSAEPSLSGGVSVSGTVSAVTSGSATGNSGTSVTSRHASVSSTPTEPSFEPEGFPISAPATPVWSGNQVIAVSPNGTVIGYVPGQQSAAVLDLGVKGVTSLAFVP